MQPEEAVTHRRKQQTIINTSAIKARPRETHPDSCDIGESAGKLGNKAGRRRERAEQSRAAPYVMCICRCSESTPAPAGGYRHTKEMSGQIYVALLAATFMAHDGGGRKRANPQLVFLLDFRRAS